MSHINIIKSSRLMTVYRDWLETTAGVVDYSRPPHTYRVDIHEVDSITYDLICVHSELCPTSTNDIAPTCGRFHRLNGWKFIDLLTFAVAWGALKAHIMETGSDTMYHVILVDETVGTSIHVPSFNTMMGGV